MTYDEYAALPDNQRRARARAGIVTDLDTLPDDERHAIEQMLARGEARHREQR